MKSACFRDVEVRQRFQRALENLGRFAGKLSQNKHFTKNQ